MSCLFFFLLLKLFGLGVTVGLFVTVITLQGGAGRWRSGSVQHLHLHLLEQRRGWKTTPAGWRANLHLGCSYLFNFFCLHVWTSRCVLQVSPQGRSESAVACLPYIESLWKRERLQARDERRCCILADERRIPSRAGFSGSNSGVSSGTLAIIALSYIAGERFAFRIHIGVKIRELFSQIMRIISPPALPLSAIFQPICAQNMVLNLIFSFLAKDSTSLPAGESIRTR